MNDSQSLQLAAGNPFDISVDDLEELALELKFQTGLDVEIRHADERGAGVTLWEVIRIWLPDQQLVEDALYAALFASVAKWFKGRFRKPHGRGRKKSAIIYGPDGRPLRRISIDTEEDEPVDEAAGDDELPHLPPQ